MHANNLSNLLIATTGPYTKVLPFEFNTNILACNEKESQYLSGKIKLFSLIKKNVFTTKQVDTSSRLMMDDAHFFTKELSI